MIDDGVTSATLSRQLEFTPPYATEALLGALAAHAIPGMEQADPAGHAHTRSIKTSSGSAVVTVSFRDPGRVEVKAQLPTVPFRGDGAKTASPAAQAAAAARTGMAEIEPILRRWLDLDTDPGPIDAALGADDVLAPMISARPGLRVLGSVDAFETAALTVLGQQVSLAAARTFGGRLVAAYGTDAPVGFRAFPEPEVLAAAAPEELQAAVGLTGARSRTLHGLATAVATGKLRLENGVDPVETRAALLQLPGIGPWTTDYLAVRVLADRDAYPSGDLVLRRALGVTTAAEAAALSEPWRPYRAYALFHLWTHDSFV